MSSAEKALFSVQNLDQANDKSPNGLSEREKKLRRSVNFRPVSLKEILTYIDLQDMDDELKAVLRKQVSRFPLQALQRFADNFEQMVNVAQRKVRKTYIVEPATATPVVEGVKPTRQYNKVKPVVEPKQVVTARKIDFDAIPFEEDLTTDLLQTPVESLDGVPVTVELEVKVNNVKQEIVAEKPKPKPKAKPVVFSANLPPEAFE